MYYNVNARTRAPVHNTSGYKIYNMFIFKSFPTSRTRRNSEIKPAAVSLSHIPLVFLYNNIHAHVHECKTMCHVYGLSKINVVLVLIIK